MQRPTRRRSVFLRALPVLGLMAVGVANSARSRDAATTNGAALPEQEVRALEMFGLRELARPPLPPAAERDEATSRALRAHILCMRAAYLTADGKAASPRVLRMLQEAAELAPDNYGIQISIARAHHRALENERAMEICDRLIRTHPDRINAYELKGQILESDGKVDDAIDIYSKTLDRWPNNDDIMNKMFRLAFARGKLDLTVKICKKRLEREPRHFRALWLLGYIYDLKSQEQKDKDLLRQSAEYYELALESLPRFTRLYPELSRIYERLEEPDKALATLRRGLVEDPSDGKIREAFEALVTKDAKAPAEKVESILAAYRELAEEYPHAADIVQAYASRLLAAGEFDLAHSQYERLLKLQPNDIDTLLALGGLELRAGHPDTARAHFARAIRRARDDVETYNKIGNTYMAAGLYDEAVAFLEKVLERDPRRVPIYMSLGQAYRQTHALDKAAEVLRRGLDAVEGSRPRKPLLLLLGTVDMERREYEDARASLREAYELDPADMLVFFQLADLLLTTEDDEALEALLKSGRKRFRRARDREQFQRMLVAHLMQYHRYEMAIPEIKSMLERDRDDWRFYSFLATAYQRLRQTANGERLFEEARERLDANSEAFLRFAVSYYTMRYDPKKANETVEKLMQTTIVPRARENAEEWFGLYETIIRNLGRLKEYDKIEAVLDRAEKDIGALDPEEMKRLRTRGLAQMRRFDEAIGRLRSASEDDPDNVDLRFELAGVLNEAGRVDEAEKELRKCLELLPEFPLTPEDRALRAMVLNHLGYLLVEEDKQLEEAERLLDEALSLEPLAGFIVDSMGWLHFKRGRSGKAIDFLEKARLYSGEDPVIYDHLGDAYAKAGDPEKARENWQQAVRLDPSLEDVKAKLEKLPDTR